MLHMNNFNWHKALFIGIHWRERMRANEWQWLMWVRALPRCQSNFLNANGSDTDIQWMWNIILYGILNRINRNSSITGDGRDSAACARSARSEWERINLIYCSSLCSCSHRTRNVFRKRKKRRRSRWIKIGTSKIVMFPTTDACTFLLLLH